MKDLNFWFNWLWGYFGGKKVRDCYSKRFNSCIQYLLSISCDPSNILVIIDMEPKIDSSQNSQRINLREIGKQKINVTW